MLTTSNFRIYNASAGSGKTFKLAERYLNLLLSSPKNTSFQNILAITFTNKAVGEMKSRILEYLVSFSEGKNSMEEDPMLLLIHKSTGLTKEQIQKKSKKVLEAILNNYAAFEVSTIDAFTHRIIRTFAKDLSLSMNFNIEMDTKQVLELAVERVVEKAGKEDELTDVLIDFAAEKVEDDKSGNISLDIINASSLLLSEKDEAYITILKDYSLKDFKQLKTKLKKEVLSIDEHLLSIGNTFLSKLKDNGLEAKDFKGGYIPKFFKKLTESTVTLTFSAQWQGTLEDENTYVTKKLNEEVRGRVFSMKSSIVKGFEAVRSLYSHKKLYEKIYRNITQLSLLGAVKEEMDLLKKEQNIMLISDFNKKISEEIKKQPAPFIYERLGEKFQHYFIDEFQDTSRLQWNNLIPLTANALSALFDDEKPGTLTLVGDAKQSIYAWRGGDAHQFIDLSQGDSPFTAEPNVETLSSNFRSNKAIVSFNNDFFEFVGHQLSDEKLKTLFSGEHLKQKMHKTEEGYVNLRFLEASSNEERAEVYPEEILKIILQKKEQGFPLGDICILIRQKSEGIAIAEYLNQQNIPIISSETLLIKSDDQVRFVLALLHVLNDDKDELSKTEVLEEIFIRLSFSEEEHFTILKSSLHKEEDVFWENLKQFGFTFDPKHFHTLPFYDAVEYLIHKFQIEKLASAYLQFFLDEVFEFTQKQNENLNAFLDYWLKQGNSKSIVSTESENAVQIMTIHKSKGLQFPVVIFPYAKQQIDYTGTSHLWVKLPEKFQIPFALITKPGKDIDNPNYTDSYLNLVNGLEMENINILYVALTRAASELFILSEDDRDKGGKIKPDTYSGLLMSYLESKGKAIEVLIEYEWGKSTLPKKRRVSEVENISIRFHSPSPNLSLNLVTTAGKLWNEDLTDALQKGNLIHSLLSKIHIQSDIDSSLEWHYTNGFFEKEKLDMYRKLLDNVVTHKQLKNYFSSEYEIWNEKDIFFGDQLLRPDRVNIKGKDAILIDYKTGKTSNQHINQINKYAESLKALKYNVKNKLLVYLNESIEVKIV
jgi:ATP-dependent exoDNAse (exonuclease V) beta subunit